MAPKRFKAIDLNPSPARIRERAKKEQRVTERLTLRRALVEVVRVVREPWHGEAGDRCPRSGCGGLVARRVLTGDEGELTQLYCVQCSRILRQTVRPVYRPYREPLTKAESALIRERSKGDVVGPAAPDIDHTLDKFLRDAVREF